MISKVKKIESEVTYKTTDGQIFKDPMLAEKRQKYIDELEELRNEEINLDQVSKEDIITAVRWLHEMELLDHLDCCDNEIKKDIKCKNIIYACRYKVFK